MGAGLLLTASTALAQKHVTGKVTDSSGQPLQGATVRVAGTKIVTSTDAQGNFKLTDVPASAKHLNISYLGMQAQTVNVAGNVSVQLQTNELGEAVVIGYGTGQKLGTIVGSVKKVSGEIVQDKPATNIADALQGQVAGLSITNNTGDVGDVDNVSITVRGTGSISADNTPLLILDGSPVGISMLSLLSSSDIESVTILKDASATSIYGSRAANGVIYITTKKGRKNEKAVVTIGQKVGWSQLARSIGNPMNADELLDFQLSHGIIYADQYATYKAHGANTNWQDYGFNDGAFMNNTDFSVRGGSENTNYYLSASYLNQDGLTEFSDFRRYTMRTNIDTRVNSWLSVGVNQSIIYTERRNDGYTTNGTSNARSFSSTATSFAPYWDPYDPEYQKQHMIWGLESYESKWLLEMQPYKYNNIIYSGLAYLQLNPIKGLTIRSQLGLYAVDSRYTGVQFTPSAAEILGESSTAEASSSRSSRWTITNTAEYKFTLDNKHDFTFLVGHEGIKTDYHGFTASASGLEDDDLVLISNATTPELGSESRYKYEYLSFFGRADYSFSKKYFANFTVRSDASSRFGKANRTALFYSGGLMWDILQEDFMREQQSWLSALQLKVSVGSTGNSEIGNYEHLGITGSTQYNGNLGYGFAQYGNPDLGWEKQIQTNVGFTAGLFGKLTLDFNFYNRKTKDMLMSVPIPYTTGLGSQTKNVGEMTNRGVELEVQYDAIRTKDWYFGIRATYSYNRNRIDKLFYDLDEWPMKSYLLSLVKGKSVNFYLPIYAGVDKEDGAPMWYKKGYSGKAGYTYDPETMTKDETQLDDLYQDTGKPKDPPHVGGFGFTLSWKGLSLVADFSFMLKKYMVNNAYYLNTSRDNALNGYNLDKDMLTKMWQKVGDEAVIPGFEYNSQFDTHLLENASFMRLKNLSLTYDLPKSIVEKTKFFSNVRFNFTTRNLFTITKYKGADPEVGANLTLGNFPATRDYTIGVEVQF